MKRLGVHQIIVLAGWISMLLALASCGDRSEAPPVPSAKTDAAVPTHSGVTGIPPGKYELTVWHETLGKQTTAIEVKEGTMSMADFTFKARN